MSVEALNRTIALPGRSATWFSAIALAALSVLGLLCWPDRPEPSYHGKSVSQWFDQALPLSGIKQRESGCIQAFEEMGGDAIPFLVTQIKAGPSWLELAVTWLSPRLPPRIAHLLPKPKPQVYYDSRCYFALELVRSGFAQKLMKGEPISKRSVNLAISALRIALRSPDRSIRSAAAATARFFGPLAAPLVPELINLGRDPKTREGGSAAYALGLMGSSASNAVPMLINIATFGSSDDRRTAVESLGMVGSAAYRAVPLLTSLVLGEEELRLPAARSLGMIGVTPDEVVPTFKAMSEGTNAWARSFAHLALWNRDRQNPELQAHVVSELQSTNFVGLLFCLSRLGTYASLFLPEINRRCEPLPEDIRVIAKWCARQIQSGSP